MTRQADWLLKYSALLAEAESRRFLWGYWDCCQFAARMVEAVTGRDPREIFPPYASEAEAVAIIAAHGDMHAFVSHALREFGEPVAPHSAQPGDIVLADFGQHLQPSVCTGVMCCAPGARGLVHRRTLSGIAAWNL